MDILGSLIIACSMYSCIPMPHVEWTGNRMKYALCFFPLVGVFVGVIMTASVMLLQYLQVGRVFYSIAGAVIPLAITGGIHMDGFLDVVDAKSSRQSMERKLEILKDSHTGAFAIIFGMVYLLLYVAVFSELPFRAFPAAGAIYVLLRAISGWSVVSFPKAKKDGLASTFSGQAHTGAVKWAMVLWAVLALGFILITSGIRFTLVVTGISAVVCFWYYRSSMREFGGITGDLAGYFLQVGELVLLAAAAYYFR